MKRILTRTTSSIFCATLVVLSLGGNFTTHKYPATDSPKLWNWPIHPENFQAPKIMELARLQAWTLKPAVRQK